MVDMILALASSQIGVKEKPPGSNRVVYSDMYGLIGPWCAMFLWAMFRLCGFSSLYYDGKKCASCSGLYNWAKRKKQLVQLSEARPGDILLMKFKKNAPEHCGLIERVNTDGSLTTIEGNTSVTSNDNGGAVMRRTRQPKNVYAIIRPNYIEETETNMECSVWSRPATDENCRVKKVPKGYHVKLSYVPIPSEKTDGKIFYKTIKGNYILAKCVK